jgi:hypothetical protein
METSAILMPWGRARRMSPRASTRMLAPSAEVLAPLARRGRERRGGSKVELMPARCPTRPKSLPFEDIVVQRVQGSEGRASHCMVSSVAAWGRPAVTIYVHVEFLSAGVDAGVDYIHITRHTRTCKASNAAMRFPSVPQVMYI